MRSERFLKRMRKRMEKRKRKRIEKRRERRKEMGFDSVPLVPTPNLPKSKSILSKLLQLLVPLPTPSPLPESEVIIALQEQVEKKMMKRND